jgi:hypothetical protein
MPDATTILMAHVAKTLPNDIRHRRELLVAMRSMMTVRHPAWSAINQHIARRRCDSHRPRTKCS